MARMYQIANTYIRDCIRAGYTQHVAFMFPGQPFEIIGDERIAHENGFTYNEYFCQEKDYTPGQVCSPKLTSTLLNYDGALVGFNYDRDFMMMVGVEKDAGTNVSFGWGTGAENRYEFAELNGIQFRLGNGSLEYNMNGQGRTVSVSQGAHMFAIRGNESAETYYLYIVKKQSDQYSFEKIYKIDENSTLATVSVSGFSPTAYLYARLAVLADHDSCEVWDFKASNFSAICHKYIRTDNSGNVTRHDILFEYYNVLVGKQPRRTLGNVITFDADGAVSKLDVSADSYADTVFTSSRNLKTIRDNLLSAVGLVGGQSVTPETSIYFSTNPFVGMHGYTYRDFLSMVGESIGRNLRESSRTIKCTVTNDVPIGITISCTYQWVTFAGYSVRNLARSDYYTYDAEEYTVQAVGLVISKQTDNDVGVSYPDAYGEQNEHIVVDNPLLALDDTSVIRSRLSYLYSAMTAIENYGYTPATIEMPSRLYHEPGDMIEVTLEDNTVAKVPIFCMTTVWNGGADCTIECTGNKTRNQYEQHNFRQALKDGGKIHELIVDIEQVYSNIMDTLTGDYSTTQQTVDMISMYVGNNAYEKVSGISITTDGVAITGNKYITLGTDGYIDLSGVALVDRSGLRVKLSDSPLYYMRLGTTGTIGADEVLNLGYENFYDESDGNNKPSMTIRTKKSKTAYEAELNIYSAKNGTLTYDMITIAPWQYGQLGTSNRTYTGGRAWDYIYGNTINYVTLVQNSSRDIKHSINVLGDFGDLIDKLCPVSFIYNCDEKEKKHFGLIFEDTFPVLPDICDGNEYDPAESKAINYTELVPILLKEIQSLRKRVQELERKTVQN